MSSYLHASTQRCFCAKFSCFHLKMLIFSFIFLLLLFNVIHNKETSCGCNVDRSQTAKNSDNDNILESLQTQDQCSSSSGDIHEKTKYLFDENASKIVLVPSGEYQLGTDDIVIENDAEGPKRMVQVKSFYLDKYEVSNEDFFNFVTETNYKTEAESFGDSFVFGIFLNSTYKEALKDFRVVQAKWWYKVHGANWRHPYGQDSDIKDMMDHPVIHVSWRDAKAYCKWRGARLPTEAEWEAACRGGHRDTKYPWGDKLLPGKKHMANIWQGTFPHHNSAKDGFVGTNPVNLYSANDFGLYNMAGNVWEWTENSWDDKKPEEKVKKGGSYLCHHSYCYRYRCSARSHNTEDSSAGNLGFRCAKSVT